MKVDIIKFIKPLLKELTFTYEKKFMLYWSELSKTQKNEFFELLAEKYMKLGMPITDVSSAICNDIEECGLLGITLTRRYIPNRFKNLDRQQNKLGKTFEKSGKETKKSKRLKKLAGKKLVEIEIEKVKLEIENTKLQKHIIELNEEMK